jgi:hypothetical protein
MEIGKPLKEQGAEHRFVGRQVKDAGVQGNASLADPRAAF